MKRGFTLVELAIVIVIVGLLISGIVAGQELVKQAKIQKTIRSFRELQLAFNTFQAKFKTVPGDVVNPGRFFPVCSGVYSSPSDSTPISGNGNGKIDTYYNNGLGITQIEATCVMLELKAAGLYEPKAIPLGFYDATIPNPPATITYSTGGYSSILWAADSVGRYEFMELLNHGFFKKNGITIVGIAQKSYINSEVAYQLDSKMDDGKPYTGILKSQSPSNRDCFTDYVAGSGYVPTITSEYTLMTDRLSCSLFYLFD